MKVPFLKTLAVATLVTTASVSANAFDLSQYSEQELQEIVTMCENNDSFVGDTLCDSVESSLLEVAPQNDVDDVSVEFELLESVPVDDICDFDTDDEDCIQ